MGARALAAGAESNSLQFMRIHARLAWILLIFAIGIGGLPRSAQADQVFGDLDRDGVGDVVSHNGSAAPVKIWLSTAPAARFFLRTHRAIVWVRVIDLDGDGRAELIGADQSSRVHIWQYRAGEIRRVHLPRQRQHVRPGSKGRVNDDSESKGDHQLPENGSDPQPCETPGAFGTAAAPSSCSIVSHAFAPTVSHTASLPPTRAPPAQS